MLYVSKATRLKTLSITSALASASLVSYPKYLQPLIDFQQGELGQLP